MTGVIRGTGSYVPPRVIENEDLKQYMETDDTWIRERTGIARRHVVEQDTTVSMAVKAAERALENADMDPEELDLILVSTVSPNQVLPSTACEVQRQIGASRAICFDINAACSGFLFALDTAQAYIHSKMAKKALIIGAETLSHLVDWGDRSTAILFGDGAGAVVLEAVPGHLPALVMHSDGSKGDVLSCESRFEPGCGSSYIQMNGQEVFRFAVKQVPLCIRELLAQCGCREEEVDLFFLHQANRRIVEGVAKRLGIPKERFPMNLEEYGNTSSASIPILLDEWNRKGALHRGMKLVLAGFGAGLSWGATYMEWGSPQ